MSENLGSLWYFLDFNKSFFLEYYKNMFLDISSGCEIVTTNTCTVQIQLTDRNFYNM